MIAIAYLFGAFGIVFNFLIYQQNTRKKLLTVKLIANCFWSVHYGFLGAWSGAVICAVGVIRETIFLNENKRWAKGKHWLLIFLILSLIGTIFTWKHIFSILPAIASALSVFSFWRGSPKLTKILAFPISSCFLIYNITCASYVGILNEVIVLSSALIGLLKSKVTSEKQLS